MGPPPPSRTRFIRTATSGTYTVRLDATNALGSCWHTSSVSVSSLAASFIQNQTTGLVPLTVLFSDTSTDQPVAWNWNFGDGATSFLQNPVHTYLAAGTYTINFSAFNGYDGWMSALTGKDHSLVPSHRILHGNPGNRDAGNIDHLQ